MVLTITNSAGLTSTIANSITVNPNPTVNVSLPAICAGQSDTLTASGATAYNWSSGSSANPLIVSPTQTTTYTVTGTNTGCVGTAEVIVNPLPQISVNNEMICQGNPVTLTAAGGTSYTWSGGLSGNPVTVTPAASTTYTVTGTDGNGCSNTVTSMVIVNAAPAVTTSPAQLICLGESVTLNTTGTNLVSYLWDPAATLSSATAPDPVATPLVTTTYTVTATDNMGCSGTGSTVITLSAVTAGFAYGPPNPADPMTIAFTDQSGTNAVSWAWDFGNGTYSAIQNPTVTYTQPGTYTVMLIVTNTEGCTDTIVQEVTVIPPFEMTIPNVFSPNSDGYNDTFGPKMEGFETFRMVIYNRWGGLVYETDSYDKLWDGTHNGNPAADGVYYFIIDVHTYAKIVYSEKGTVTLMR